MKRKLLLLFVLMNYTGSFIIAQEKAINIRYKGGEKALRELFSRNLRYPEKSLTNKISGYSITGITVTPNGNISEILTINPLDESIEKEIYRIIQMTKNEWLICDTTSTNQTFYVQIIYELSELGGSPIFDSVGEKYNFIEPIVLIAFATKREPLPEIDETTIIEEKLKVQDYTGALNIINESIRRNPFNKELYQLRMYINRKLNDHELVINDAQKIQNFIPGVSLEELINKN